MRSLFDLRAVYGRQSLWQESRAAIAEAVGPQVRPRAGQRLSRQPAAADVLPECRRRQLRRAEHDVPSRAQRAEAAGRRRPRLRPCGAGRGRAARRIERLVDCARACCRSRKRYSVTPPTRCGSCCGSRAASGSARARDGSGAARRAAQPPRSPGAQERVPVDPAAARVHGRSRMADEAVSERRVSRPLPRAASSDHGRTRRRSSRCASSCSTRRRPA